MGKVIALIGKTGQGKSRFVTNYLKKPTKREALAYDVNGYEYGEKWGVNLSLDTKQKRCRYTGIGLPAKQRYKTFVNLVSKRRNCDVVYEEATGYLSGKIEDDIKGQLIDKRHTGNNYFFIFHSIRDIPPSLLPYIDIIYLFKTGDSYEEVKSKDKRLLPAWSKMQGQPDGAPGILIDWSGTMQPKKQLAK